MMCAYPRTPASAITATTGTISGKITDGRNVPVVGAVITARGTTNGWTATLADGSFVLHVPPGAYDVLVRKGGYTPGMASIVVKSATTQLVLALADANLNSVNVGSARANSTLPFNATASATATLLNAAIGERPDVTVREIALELPGLNLAHPAGSVPDTSLAVRGGTIETRLQIDGHPVSAGATARWNSSYASEGLFDSIEVVKGAALAGANAGESAFGTVNLRTRDFARGEHADAVVGVDGFGGQYSQFALAGTALRHDRLSYVFEHNVYGYNGRMAGPVVANTIAQPNGKAVLADQTPLASPFTLGSDLAKLRCQFAGTTSLTLGYVGVHGQYGTAGGAYGTYLGGRNIVPFVTVPYAGTIYSSPHYVNLIGTTVPAYTFGHNTRVQTNQPLFEAELRTAIGNDTLLIRPYIATIYNVLDGSKRAAGPDPSGGTAWGAITSGSGCSTQSPCFVPMSTFAAERDQERDTLHGTTVTLIHAMGDGSLNLSYDYRSDQTTVARGNPEFNNTDRTAQSYFTTIPTTLARNYDVSATYDIPLTGRLRFFIADYYTDWRLAYGTIPTPALVANGSGPIQVERSARGYTHNDPHVGLSWRPQSNTSFRFTGGSAVTVPYAQLVAGAATYSDQGSGRGTFALINPALRPESTVAYDLGVDHRLRDDTVVTADVFDNTIHDVFATEVTPFSAAALGLPPDSPINSLFATITMPLNAPIERNYGLELSLTHAPVHGLGYYAAATFQRAYVTRLPASFFTGLSSLVNGKQLDGASAIPYTHAYGELTYRNTSGIGGSLGADYTGTNNWTNGPAFVVCNSMLRYDFRGGYRAQFSIANLFDRSTGTQLAAGTGNAGFADVGYGSSLPGQPFAYGATPTTRFAIPPRTFRFQLEAHLGR